jgi:hypothetical protein
MSCSFVLKPHTADLINADQLATERHYGPPEVVECGSQVDLERGLQLIDGKRTTDTDDPRQNGVRQVTG